MFIFLKLYLAHLIGDFILQFEELYRLKTRSWVGHLLHVLIHAAVSAALLFPFLGENGVLLFILAVTVLHLGEDLLKYSLQQKYPQLRFFLFTADQMIHAAVISLVFLFPIHNLEPAFPESSVLGFYYASNLWTLLAIVFILTTFGAAYFMHAFRVNYWKDSRPDHFITRFEMAHGLIERTLISGFFLFGSLPLAFAAALLCGLPRFLHPKLRSLADFVLSAGLAALLGFLFKSGISFE